MPPPLPIPDPACGGNGDGIARVPAALVPAEDGTENTPSQADERLVTVGTARQYVNEPYDDQVVPMRLDAEGPIDDRLGADHDGLVRTAFPGDADDVAQTTDRGFVYVGHGLSFDSMIVGRLHADGAPDTSFFGSGRRLIAPAALVDGAGADTTTPARTS